MVKDKKLINTREGGLDIEGALDRIETHFFPVSIFLYGSRARNDAIAESDYELGVLIPSERFIDLATIRNIVKCSRVSAYPQKLEDFISCNMDTPFNKNIHITEIVRYGKTLRGERVIENLCEPKISTIDLYSEVQFNLGYALGAVIADRNGSRATATTLFYKSCFFGTRSLIATRTGSLLASYVEISEKSRSMDLGTWQYIVDRAYEARGSGECETRYFFENITYLNQFVLPEVRERLNQDAANKSIGLS